MFEINNKSTKSSESNPTINSIIVLQNLNHEQSDEKGEIGKRPAYPYRGKPRRGDREESKKKEESEEKNEPEKKKKSNGVS